LLQKPDIMLDLEGKKLARKQQALASSFGSSWPTGHAVKRMPKQAATLTSDSSPKSKSKDDSRKDDRRLGSSAGRSSAVSAVSNFSRCSSAPNVPANLQPAARCNCVDKTLMQMKPDRKALDGSSSGPLPMLRYCPVTRPAMWWAGKQKYTVHVPVFVTEEPQRLTIDELLAAENPFTNGSKHRFNTPRYLASVGRTKDDLPAATKRTA